MKFISKSSNLLIVLKPGLSANSLAGTVGRPTVSVRFKEGVAEVPEGELLDMMLAHPGMGGDYIAAETDFDPYASFRPEVEPQHIVTELKFGTPIAMRKEGGNKASLPPELAALVKEMASNLAKEMLPGMVEATLKTIVENRKEETASVPEVEGEEEGDVGVKPSVQKPKDPKDTEKKPKTAK